MSGDLYRPPATAAGAVETDDTAEVQITVDDMVAAHELALGKQRRRLLWRSSILAVALIALGAASYVYGDGTFSFLALVGIISLFSLFLSARSATRKVFERQFAELGVDAIDARYRLDGPELIIDSEDTTTRVRPDNLFAVAENDHMLILHRTSLNFQIVPKDKISPAFVQRIKDRLRIDNN